MLEQQGPSPGTDATVESLEDWREETGEPGGQLSVPTKLMGRSFTRYLWKLTRAGPVSADSVAHVPATGNSSV